MSIETQCPACSKAYKLKDELAGKRVTCANPTCRFVFPVPKAGTGTAPTLAAMKAGKAPVKSAAEVEVAALAALNDDPDEVPVDSRTIAMSCEICEHKWTEPWDKQGKNTVCPECRTRQKVPVPQAKAGAKQDWRKGGPGPSMAKREALEGVSASGDAGYVSGESLRSAGLGLPQYEARPLWQKVFVVAFPLLLLMLGGYAYLAYTRSRTDTREIETMTDALADLPDDKDSPLPKSEIAVYRAALLIAALEYHAARDKPDAKGLTDTMNLAARARTELETAPAGIERDVLFQELCRVIVKLGGTPEQIESGNRIRWTPQGGGSARARISEKTYDVQNELRLAMTAMRGQDRVVNAEVRKQILRLVARDLSKAGEGDVVERLIPALFGDEEQIDATAIAGWEIFKANGDLAKASAAVAGLGIGSNPPPALLALAQVVEPVPPMLKLPPYAAGTSALDDVIRAAHGYTALLKNNPGEAIEIAKRPGRTDGRLRLLALAAEVSNEPGPAVAAAAEIVATDGKKRELGIPSDDVLIRLAGQAGRAGQADKLDIFAKAGSRDDARSLARATFLQGQSHAGAKLADEAVLEIPPDAKDYRLGHAWGRLLIARGNAKGSIALPADRYESWGKSTFRAFGLAGYTLGRQDAAAR